MSPISAPQAPGLPATSPAPVPEVSHPRRQGDGANPGTPSGDRHPLPGELYQGLGPLLGWENLAELLRALDE